MNSTPRMIPITAPITTERTISASPIRTISAGRTDPLTLIKQHLPGESPPGRLLPAKRARRARLRRSCQQAPALALRRRWGLDDHPARALGQHGLERLAEHRAAVDPLRERHHDRGRAHVDRLLDDPPPGLAAAHALH